MDINANINIDDTQLSELINTVKDNIDLTDDIESYLNDNVEDHVKTSIDDCLSDILDDRIESYLNDNLDSAVDRAVDDIDFSSRFDIEYEARSLLTSYNPENSCSTGIAFKDAIATTIAYLKLNDEEFKHIIASMVHDSIQDVVKDYISETVKNELKNGISNTIKAEIFANLRSAFIVAENPRY